MRRIFGLRKARVFLKTYAYSAHEMKFVKLNIREALPYVDGVILCEFNRTHLGSEREYILHRYIDEFSPAEMKKLVYLRCDISKEVSPASDSDQVHKNENLMRGYFVNEVDLHPNDIVISVDADEIIFGQYYDRLIAQIGNRKQAIKLKLHQFFYKVNYLWVDETFIAPTIARASFYEKRYPGQWRYDGSLFPEIVGAHYSWCMTVDEMIKKLQVYSHHYDYRHLADRHLLEQAIREKTYPFESSRRFKIRVLDMFSERDYYPRTIYTMLDEFSALIAKDEHRHSDHLV